MAESLFNFLNLVPLPVWFSMMFFPKARFTERMVMSYWIYIGLGAVYTLSLLYSMTQGGGVDLSFNGLRVGLTNEWGFVTGWTHYLALDLFVGVWIFRDAKYWGIRTTWYLLVTLFAAPLGLALYLFVRERKDKTPQQRIFN
ncbi:MAG: ABA4-like family protein [Deinococcota bacterium]